MRKYIIITITSICLLLTFQACHTSRKAARTPKTESHVKQSEVYDKLRENIPAFETINISKMNINLMLAGQNISARGFMRIIKDSVILISAQTLGFEVGRIRITPDSIDVIDRINSSHYSANAEFIGKTLGFNFDFNVIQSLLTNQIFIYDKDPETLAKKDFFVTPLPDGGFELKTKEEQPFNSMFITNPQARLRSTVMLQNLSPQTLSVDYSDFTEINNITFPHKINITLFDGKRANKIEIYIGNVNFNTPIDATFSIPARFNKLKVESLNF
jgi:hypothetical protein